MKASKASETVPFPVLIETRTTLLRNATRRLVFAEHTDPRPLLQIIEPSRTTFLVTEIYAYGLADHGDGNLAVGYIDLAALATFGAVLDAGSRPSFPCPPTTASRSAGTRPVRSGNE